MSCYTGRFFNVRRGWQSLNTGPVLFTSHPKDGLVVNLYIPHNRRMSLQAEEALGPISIPRGSRGVGPFERTSASRTEKPGAYSTPGTPLGGGGGR